MQQDDVNESKNRWGEFLNAQLERRATKNYQLADAIGVDRSTIGKWRSGIIEAPGPDKVRAVAEALNAPIYDAYIAAGILRENDSLEVHEVSAGLSSATTAELMDELRLRLLRLETLERKQGAALAFTKGKAQSLPPLAPEPFQESGQTLETAHWPGGQAVTDDEAPNYLHWLAAGRPADFQPFRTGQTQSGYALAAQRDCARKSADPQGLDDGVE